MKRLVYATTNPGKFAEVAKLFSARGITLHSPVEFGVKLDVDETGNTLEENATLKAETFRDALPPDTVVIGDDTGLEIDALGGEPGIKVRRWKGYKMTDEEIISYTLERLGDIPEGERTAQFRTVLAVAKTGSDTQVFNGIHRISILTQALPTREPGFPFRSLIAGSEPAHRVHAVDSALPYLEKLIDQVDHTPGV